MSHSSTVGHAFTPGKRKTRGTTSSSESDVSPQQAHVLKRPKPHVKTLKKTSDMTDHVKAADKKMIAEMKKVKEETIREMKEFMTEFITKKFDKLANTMSQNLSELEEKMDERIGLVEDDCGKFKTMFDRVIQENRDLKIEVKQLKDLALEAKSHAISNEQYSRKCNVKIFGVQEDKDENCAEKVQNLIREKLGVILEPSEVIVAHRVRAYKSPYPIIVRFNSYATKMQVLKVRAKLKGQGVSIGEDLCRDLQLVLNRAFKDDRVKESWAWNGKINIKDEHGRIHNLQHGQSLDEVLSRRDTRANSERPNSGGSHTGSLRGQTDEEMSEHGTDADLTSVKSAV